MRKVLSSLQIDLLENCLKFAVNPGLCWVNCKPRVMPRGITQGYANQLLKNRPMPGVKKEIELIARSIFNLHKSFFHSRKEQRLLAFDCQHFCQIRRKITKTNLINENSQSEMHTFSRIIMTTNKKKTPINH